MPEIKTAILDFDDLAPDKPGYDLLIKLKEHFPNFKCTCFTPAFNMKVFTKEISSDKFKQWAGLIKNNWLEIAPHGFAHIKGECQISRKEFQTMLKAIENMFKYLELPYVKVFKAPHWLISEEAEQVLAENGYTLAIDRNRPIIRAKIPTYVWNWSIDEPIPDWHELRGHGHIHLTNNGLDKCLPNLLKLPQNVIFKTIGEYVGLQPINN